MLVLLLIVAFWLTTMPSAARPEPMPAAALPGESETLTAQPNIPAVLHPASDHQTSDPTPTATPYPPSDNCVNCHTDKAKLQELAEEPEKVKSEMASGEG